MARKHSPRIPKERFRPAPPAAVVLNLLSMTGNYFSICQTEIWIYLILIPKSLDVRGLIGVKECILKPRTFVLWTPHKEHTESAIRKDHLAPCRFKCWTNQISIGISQPLAQLQCRYNVEIPRVSLHVAGAKWDFRTDSCQYHASDMPRRHVCVDIQWLLENYTKNV
jgi:hypothetical protein